MRRASARSPGSQLTQCWLTCIALGGALIWSSRCPVNVIPLALRQLRDIAPPGASPLAEDADVVLSLRFYFLTARIPLATAQVQHLSSPERLVFGSAPLPRVAKRPRHAAPFSLADLIERLRQLFLVVVGVFWETARVGTQAPEEAMAPVAILLYGLLSPRCWCHGVLATFHHAWRMLQLPVMHDLVARHLWAVHTVSPLRRGVC